MHVLVALQTLTDLADDTAQKLICGVADFQVFLDAKFECEFDEIERVSHNLIGKKPGMLRQKFHAALHDAAIVDFVDRPNDGLEDQEKALDLSVIKSAAGLETELKALEHANYRLQFRFVLLDVLSEHHRQNTLRCLQIRLHRLPLVRFVQKAN